MERPTVAIRSIKPIVWIARCTGQLPVLWDEEAGLWYVAPWYHPQFLYFGSLLLVRTVIYVSTAYAIIASQFSFDETASFSAIVVSEMTYVWLRLFLPPYLLLLKLRPLAGAVRKLQKVDSLLGIDTNDWACKPRKLTVVLHAVTTITVPLVLFVQKNFYSWYVKQVPSEMFCRLMVAWIAVDLFMETAIVIQFCLAALLLQQRLSIIGDQLNMISERKFLGHVVKDGAAFSKIHTPLSLSRLRYTYSLVYQYAEEIMECFGLPLFSITLGETLLLTFHVYGIIHYKRMENSKESVSMISYSLVILAIHSVFVLSKLFHFADKMNTEVSNLTTLLQAKVCSMDVQEMIMKEELREFHQIVSMNPFPRTSAAGFYNIGKSLVPGIMGVIFTYLVVLVQFDNMPPPCRCNSTTAASS